MIISRTPFRISFFGGGTDYPEFYREHGGAVLFTTINKYCYISLHTLSPFFKHRFRASYATTESVLLPGEFKHPLIRETLLHIGIEQGVEISHVADLPGRTGLGSSSSFTVGLLNALHRFTGTSSSPELLAEEAIHIERERVGDAGGHQDQFAAAYGGMLKVSFRKQGSPLIEPLPISSGRVAELENHLLLFYTGIEQSAEKTLTEQRQRTRQNTAGLLQMLAMVDEARTLLCGSGDLTAFGRLLDQSWKIKKGLSSGISSNTIDEAYQAAMAAGACGGKLLGAGGRGFLLVFAPPERHASVRAALAPLQEVRVSLASKGSEIIFSTDAT